MTATERGLSLMVLAREIRNSQEETNIVVLEEHRDHILSLIPSELPSSTKELITEYIEKLYEATRTNSKPCVQGQLLAIDTHDRRSVTPGMYSTEDHRLRSKTLRIS